MATIVQIDGVGKVELDDSFKSLSPAQQQSTVDEIANHHAASSASAPDVPVPEGWKKPTAAPIPAQNQQSGGKPYEAPGAAFDRNVGDILSSTWGAAKGAFGDAPLSASIPSGVPAHIGGSYIPNPLAVAAEIGGTGMRALSALPAAAGAGVAATGRAFGMDPTQAYKLGQDISALPEALGPMGAEFGGGNYRLPAAADATAATGMVRTAAGKVPGMVQQAADATTGAVKRTYENTGTKIGDILAGPDVAIAERKLADLTPAVSNQATMLEAGQTATGTAPPLARPINEAGNAALKEQSDPLFAEAFKPTSTAPLKDQYENANKAAGLELRNAQNAVSDAENSHTQLLAKANDQTSVYDINPDQISQSEKAIEEANKNLELAQVQKDQIAKDLRGVQEDILSGKQGAAYTPQISILMNNPKVRKGISQGIAVMRDEADANGVPLNLTDLGVKLDKTGNPILDVNGDVQVIGVPKTRLLHIAKIGLNDIYNGYKDKDTGIISQDSKGAANAVKGLADSLVTELRTVNPKYNEAMDIAQKYITSKKGFTKGATSIFNDKIDERTFARMLKNMTPEEIDALPEGVSNYTYELTRKLPAETAAGETANPALPQPSMLVPKNVISQRSQGKLAMVPKIGPEKAQTFIETLRDVKSNPARVSKANEELAKALAARKKTIRNVALAGAGAVGLGAAGRHVMPYVLP